MGTSNQLSKDSSSHGAMRVLAGWKEISAYLRHGVRTVQRWEAIGLPIRRIGVGPVRPVIAFAEELDAWERAAPTHFFDVIAELKAKVYSLEIQLASLKQERENEKHRSSLQNQSESRIEWPQPKIGTHSKRRATASSPLNY